MEVPITQSKEWVDLQSDLKEKHYYEEGNGYRFLIIVKNTPFGKYLYLPYGPYVEKDNKVLIARAIRNVRKIARRENAIFIRIEPQVTSFIKDLPYKIVKSADLNPAETWILDLEGTDDDLNKKLPSRLQRYYRNIEKSHITIETSHNPSDIKYLLTLQRELANKKGINTFSEDYLKTELSQPFSTLYLLKYTPPEENKSEVIAVGLVFDYNQTRYNLQGAQSEQGRKLHATGILTIRLIKDAKAKKLKCFDFWGIAPEDAPDNHPWKGFTNFKKMFDGYEVKYAGTYDIVLKPFKYNIYCIIRRINRLLRKV